MMSHYVDPGNGQPELFLKTTFKIVVQVSLLWNLIVNDEYDVSTSHLRALFTYWCHECCLRFRRDNLVVNGRQMVWILVSVYGMVSLVPVGFTVQYFSVLHGH